MILVDTSVWIDHLHSPEPGLRLAIVQDNLLMHPYVIAELAMGSIPRRAELVAALQALPQLSPVSDADLLIFVDDHQLFGTGLGMVDGHLLVSAATSENTQLWTRDKQLGRQAERLGLAYDPVS